MTSNKDIYRKLCAETRGIPVFAQAWWWDAVAPSWDVAITHNGSRPGAAWPYKLETKAGINIIRNPVLTPYCEPVILYPPDLKPAKRDNFQYEHTENLLGNMPPAKVWSLAFSPDYKQTGIFRRAKFHTDVRQTFRMNLQDEEGNIFQNLHEDYRRNIRKANQELRIENEPANVTELYQYLKSTLSGKGVQLPYPQETLQTLMNTCLQNRSGALYTARKEGIIQAIQLHVWDDEGTYYLAGAKNPDVKDNKAMTALLWHSMVAAKHSGKHFFDFEGSMDAGVEKFFRNFGANREMYLTIHKNDSFLWKIKGLLGK